jgi:Zn-finger nucleic acid-binding protein
MSVASFEGIEVDRCLDCSGMWFDALEVQDLRHSKGAGVLDTGDAQRGAQHDTIGKIKCPVHAVPMVRMVDREQPHVWYEQCPTCYGIYLDAGEFRDLMDRTLSDMVKHWRKGQRPLS